MDIIRIEGIRFPVGVRCMLGHSAVINETDLFIIPRQSNFRSFFQAGQTVLPVFLYHGRARRQLPPLFFQSLDELEETPKFVQFVCPLPLELIER